MEWTGSYLLVDQSSIDCLALVSPLMDLNIKKCSQSAYLHIICKELLQNCQAIQVELMEM
jgi:hypothetical protein